MKARTQLQAGKLAVGYPATRDEAVLNCGGVRFTSVLYDFASDGGAIGNVFFGRLIPAGAIVTKVVTDEQTATTGGAGFTVTLRAGSTALTGALDLTASAGIQAPALAGSAAGIKLAAESELNIAIAVAAITAGKVRFYVEYLLQTDTAQ